MRKALDAIKKMADDEIKCKSADESSSDEEKSEKPSTEECEKFGTFWKEFGRALKLGILEDDNNRYAGFQCANKPWSFAENQDTAYGIKRVLASPPEPAALVLVARLSSSCSPVCDLKLLQDLCQTAAVVVVAVRLSGRLVRLLCLVR